MIAWKVIPANLMKGTYLTGVSVLKKVSMAPVALIEVHHVARQQLAHTRG